MDDILGKTTLEISRYAYDQIEGRTGHILKISKNGIEIGSVEYVKTKECYVFTSIDTAEATLLSPSLLRSKNLIKQYF